MHSDTRNQGSRRARLDSRNQARWVSPDRPARRRPRPAVHPQRPRLDPLIVEAALKNRQTSFVIDGEAVLLGVDGVSDFNTLHSRRHDDEVQLYAFDILALGGEDLRKLPLALRKTNLARLLARRPEGIFVSDFEQGEIGPDLFRAACNFGLEGLVSKRRDRPYRAGRSPDWIKVKNRKHPAIQRVKEAFAY